MNLELPVIRISVRNLVEFILRTGDIDNRIAAADKDAMLLGGKIHRKIQRMMGADYHAEVSLKYETPMDGFLLKLEGRADGIQETADGYLIDEIKGVYKDVKHMKEPVPVHLAQAKCYAYIFAKQKDLKQISVQMTYCQMETEEIRRFKEAYETSELEEWFLDLIHAYEKWGRYQVTWKEKRNQSIKAVDFPFAYREGQKDLVTSVYRTILRKKKLFIQAPTGVGKTIATVFPSVKAVGEGLAEKIFYLTAKTITRTAALAAFETLKKQDLAMKVLVLTAKEKICFCEETNCNPQACPYAEGHFDRVNDAVYELLTSTDEMSRELIEAHAKKWKVCPFEMALDLSLWVDAIICDYNYVFDPNAHLKRFFGEGVSRKGEYLFLIDEAHNLVDRGREMYTASLCKEDVMKIRRMMKGEDRKLEKSLESLNKAMLALKRECESCQILENASTIYLKGLNVNAEFERYLEETRKDQGQEESGQEEKRKELLEFYFELRFFLTIYEQVDENYLTYSEIDENGQFKVWLYCVNPATQLKNYLENGRSTIFFSATLLPVQYYKKLLSTEKDDYAIYANSSFPPENREILLGTDVSTKYTRRGPEMYERYADYLIRAAKAKKGNYLAFFPSYRFMEEVFTCFLQKDDAAEIEYLMQAPYMTEEARESFLESFETERQNSFLGFCVMGGIFSEGIDLAEERLIGALVVGTGLPQVCRERELLKQYFDAHGERGFDYAYLYPGMNKVLQAAGRVIRTETDRGVILLLDDRFGDFRYRETFPREWANITYCNLENVSAKIHSFWNSDSFPEKNE